MVVSALHLNLGKFEFSRGGAFVWSHWLLFLDVGFLVLPLGSSFKAKAVWDRVVEKF